MLRAYESKEIAEMYVNYRRSYDEQVIRAVINYLKLTNGTAHERFDLMLDVGCGSGQATCRFAGYFAKVIGSDVSANQVAEANRANRFDHVTYVQGCAERLDVPDGCVDLVLSAKAAHWFDLPAFFQEVKRVLKPKGCLALVCTNFPRIYPVEPVNPKAGIADYKEVDIVAKYICKGLYHETAYAHILDGYAKIFEAIPSNDKERNDEIKMQYDDWDLGKVAGFLYSIDSIQNHMLDKKKTFKANNFPITDELIRSVDLVEHFRSELRKKWNLGDEPDSEVKIKGSVSVFILLATDLKAPSANV